MKKLDNCTVPGKAVLRIDDLFVFDLNGDEDAAVSLIKEKLF